MAHYKIFTAIEWRDEVRAGRLNILDICEFLQGWKKKLGTQYRSVQGGKRDHDLGWILEALADLYGSIGGDVSYDTKFTAEAEYVVVGPFVRFCEQFITTLPDVPGVERPVVRDLIKKHFRKLRIAKRD